MDKFKVISGTRSWVEDDLNEFSSQGYKLNLFAVSADGKQITVLMELDHAEHLKATSTVPRGEW